MEIQTLSFQTEGLLSVVQFASAQKNTLDYFSLNEALKGEKIALREKEEGAEVNNLLVLNKADKPVFIMDGDILEGAKQNRVVNSSVLLAPNSKVNLPVSCVEEGRWRMMSDKFMSADYSAPFKMRFNKEQTVRNNLKMKGTYFADQGKVWEDVYKYHSKNSVHSKSSNLSDMYKQYKTNIDEIADSFKFNEESNGYALFVKNNLLCLDIFNRSAIAGEYFSKIIKGALFEIINLKEKKNEITKAEAEYKTKVTADSFDELKYNKYKSISLGDDIRYESNKISASELRYENEMVHLSALNLA